jgi:DNA invertase Pin-like site-specific DNA recombinase
VINHKEVIKVNKEKIIYKAALYCRLSSDDGNPTDSSSIETQKMMLKKYCLEHEFLIYNVYVDDGYSGLNYDRPAFNRMIDDIEKKNINMIITKDLSRLGRDYIQTGYYTDIFFRSKKIRYIAINDNVDTIHDNNDITPFKNILNDMYSRDLSKKIKSAKRERAYQGLFISSQPPYGYLQDKEDGNHLVIDEVAAKTVRLIFKLALEGNGGTRIAHELTRRKITTPAELRRSRGDTTFNRFIKEGDEEYKYRWRYATVRMILCDKVYMGDMVNRKYETINYKTKERVRVPEEDRIVVENTHQAIISRRDFKLVQKYMKSRHSKSKNKHENLFKGILFCSQCGKRLALGIKPSGNNSVRAFYKCMNHYNNPKECIRNNQVNYAFLKLYVKNYINNLFVNSDTETEFIKYYTNTIADHMDLSEHQVKRDNLESRQNLLIAITKKMYEDFAKEIIDETTYKKLISEYQQEQTKIKDELKNYTNDSDEEKVLQSLKYIYKIISKYKKNEESSLSVEIINELIEKIVVSPVKKINKRYFNELKIILVGFNKEI